MKKNSEVRNKTLLFSSLLLVILLGFTTLSSYNYIQQIKQDAKESEWNYIESVLKENQDKAKIQATDIRDSSKKDISETYADDKTGLKYDMDNLNVNSNFLKILNDNIADKFLNVNNDNNDLFVMSTWQKNLKNNLKGAIITDKSINCSANGEVRTFDTELTMHYNYDLGYDAIHRILTQNTSEPIFWEFLKSDNPNHKKLTACSLQGLKDIYMSEGIEGLKGYEFLNLAYINDKDDIFGIDKINNMGSLDPENRQIIIVQGFSLYDVLMQSHKTSMLVEEKQNESLVLRGELYGSFGVVLIFVTFISITKVQNLSIELEELGDSKSDDKTKE
jgi:hypothetical protein